MNHSEKHVDRIPISVSLDQSMGQQEPSQRPGANKKRMAFMAMLAVGIGCCVSIIAKALVYLINLFTNISFHHSFSISPSSPATHTYGIFVIFTPAIGGFIVGLMALYGSTAIRGHGIP